MITAFVIYEQPSGYSHRFVMRKWLLSQDPLRPGIFECRTSPWVADNIDELRRQIPDGMNVRRREPADNENIVETWV